MRKFLLTTAAVLFATAAHAGAIRCGAPFTDVGDAYDRDPVVLVEVSYNAPYHAWQIFHHLSSGGVVARAQQYAIVDQSNGNITRWGGSLNRNRNLYMIGQVVVDYHNGDAFYEEWLYDRSRGNRLDTHTSAHCRLVVEAAAPPVAPVPVPVPVVPVVPVPVAPPAPVAAAPVQQNGPIVVAPPSSNNVTITVIPGTSYTPMPKSEQKTESGS